MNPDPRPCPLVPGWLLILILAMGVLFCGLAAKAKTADQDAHERADTILFPRFTAAINTWSRQHGYSNDPGHFQKLDAGDLKRWKEAQKAWHEYEQAMKDAGY